jgi:hypothetical protein
MKVVASQNFCGALNPETPCGYTTLYDPLNLTAPLQTTLSFEAHSRACHPHRSKHVLNNKSSHIARTKSKKQKNEKTCVHGLLYVLLLIQKCLQL